MNIGDSLYWDVDINVGAEVGRGNNGRVEIHVDEKVGHSDGEGVEL